MESHESKKWNETSEICLQMIICPEANQLRKQHTFHGVSVFLGWALYLFLFFYIIY